MRNGTRERLLDDVMRGLRAVALDAPLTPLCFVEVVLLDAAGRAVVADELSIALGWIVGQQRVTEDTEDITTAVEAHVRRFEHACACGKDHRTPSTSP